MNDKSILNVDVIDESLKSLNTYLNQEKELLDELSLELDEIKDSYLVDGKAIFSDDVDGFKKNKKALLSNGAKYINYFSKLISKYQGISNNVNENFEGFVDNDR